ncbi:MAG: alanine racemase [Clostridiales bacterium]|nr:alanine racemase [Clostridiales bacterium]
MKEENYNGQYLRVCANVDLDAICDNIKATKNIVKEGTKIMAVIKADGYGHGAVPLARVLDPLVDWFAVAIVEEGIELREAGFTKPILVLGYSAKAQLTDVVHYDLTQTIFSYEMAKCLDEEARRQEKIVQIHIKLDTGMGRIGYQPALESINEIVQINTLSNAKINGIFTHFACADMIDKTSAKEQLRIYLDFVNKLEGRGVHFEVKHVSNSAGIIDMPEANLDMVRSGISTYGLYPSDEVHKEQLLLKPAMELKTHISFVKELEAGHGIGYGSTYVTKKHTKIATVPVGYADGFSRQLSNKGKVLVHGQYAPIIGRVCMDQFMIDITDIPDVKPDDVVTLIGHDGDKMITVEEVAELAGSFNYEYVCNVGKRVPRVYYQNGKPVSIRYVQ